MAAKATKVAPHAPKEEPTPMDLHQKTQMLAYQLWIERGCPIGSDQADWFRAEEMILNAPSEEIVEELAAAASIAT